MFLCVLSAGLNTAASASASQGVDDWRDRAVVSAGEHTEAGERERKSEVRTRGEEK